MKYFFIGMVFLLIGGSGWANDLRLRGQPFKPAGIEITWTAPRSNLPVTLWIYKVTPQQFPLIVISNLMELGAFTMKDKRPVKDAPFKDKNAFCFQDKEETRHLAVFPSQGIIEYEDSSAVAGMKEPVENVPDEEESLRIALKFLHACGIDSSQLAVRLSGDFRFYRRMGRRGLLDKKTGSERKEVYSRGISFMRRIDRIDFTGIGNAGGFSINLGNNGKVGDLQIVWRNLEPYKSCNIATPEQFVRWIKEGVGVISNRESLDLDWKEVKKLNITKLTPYYLGETGDTIQQTVVPFADLEIRAELPTTNLTFHVSCPIVEGKN